MMVLPPPPPLTPGAPPPPHPVSSSSASNAGEISRSVLLMGADYRLSVAPPSPEYVCKWQGQPPGDAAAALSRCRVSLRLYSREGERVEQRQGSGTWAWQGHVI